MSAGGRDRGRPGRPGGWQGPLTAGRARGRGGAGEAKPFSGDSLGQRGDCDLDAELGQLQDTTVLTLGQRQALGTGRKRPLVSGP